VVFWELFVEQPMSHTHLHLNFFNEKDKRAQPGNLPEGVAVSEIRALWVEKYFHLLSFGRLTGESSLLGPACVNVNKYI